MKIVPKWKLAISFLVLLLCIIWLVVTMVWWIIIRFQEPDSTELRLIFNHPALWLSDIVAAVTIVIWRHFKNG